jgi:inner membrane protein
LWFTADNSGFEGTEAARMKSPEVAETAGSEPHVPFLACLAGAIAGLVTAYTAAVLKSWRRGGFIGTLLVALYVVLYVLLSLEAYSLLIGSLILFVALAAVMYATRNLNWAARPGPEEAPSP